MFLPIFWICKIRAFDLFVNGSTFSALILQLLFINSGSQTDHSLQGIWIGDHWRIFCCSFHMLGSAHWTIMFVPCDTNWENLITIFKQIKECVHNSFDWCFCVWNLKCCFHWVSWKRNTFFFFSSGSLWVGIITLVCWPLSCLFNIPLSKRLLSHR